MRARQSIMRIKPTASPDSSTSTTTQNSNVVPVNFSTANEVTQLREAWIEHQINPLREEDKPGIPFSALND
jgi:hypothetical protein